MDFPYSECGPRRKCIVCKKIQVGEYRSSKEGCDTVLRRSKITCKIRAENIREIIMAFEFDTQSLVSNESFHFDTLYLILRMAQNINV